LARRGTPLRTRVHELERKLAESVPRSEVEALQAKIRELEARLVESVPKAELESAKARIKELEAKLAAAPEAKPPSQ